MHCSKGLSLVAASVHPVNRQCDDDFHSWSLGSSDVKFHPHDSDGSCQTYF